MSRTTPGQSINILIADDDKDDCLLFKEALDELGLSTKLTAVHDGDQLMQLLTKNAGENFDLLFLDLNMPRKGGLACLKEIKLNEHLQQLPVIIFSTSYEEITADLLFKAGAQHYMGKPSNFSQLKNVIGQAVTLVMKYKGEPGQSRQSPGEQFSQGIFNLNHPVA